MPEAHEGITAASPRNHREASQTETEAAHKSATSGLRLVQ